MINMNNIRIITGDEVDIPVWSGRHNKQDQAVMENGVNWFESRGYK